MPVEHLKSLHGSFLIRRRKLESDIRVFLKSKVELEIRISHRARSLCGKSAPLCWWLRDGTVPLCLFSEAPEICYCTIHHTILGLFSSISNFQSQVFVSGRDASIVSGILRYFPHVFAGCLQIHLKAGSVLY